MRQKHGIAAGLAIAVVLATFVACSSSDSGTGPITPVDLTGNYSLSSLTFGGIPTTAGGTMVMTSSTFADSIHVTAPIDTLIKLTGTYVARSNDSIYLTPTVPPSLPQVPGTFVRNTGSNALTLTLSFSGTVLVSLWQKQ
jgi:hypothetical protein